jgi:hypothetical protein
MSATQEIWPAPPNRPVTATHYLAKLNPEQRHNVARKGA